MLFIWLLMAYGPQGSWSHGCPCEDSNSYTSGWGLKGKESEMWATASSDWRRSFSSTLWILILLSPHHTSQLSKGQHHWRRIALTVWPLSSEHAVQTKAVTVLLGRPWLPVAWACQSSVRAEIPQASKVLTALGFPKDKACTPPLSFLHLYSNPIVPSPSGPLLIIFSWTCFLPYLFQLFPLLHYSLLLFLT